MSTIYNPEAETIAQIERLELEAREIYHKIEHVKRMADRRVLNRQLKELQDQIEFLRTRLP